MKFCPQCGTAFEASARFCLECGFDRSAIITAEPVIASTPGVIVTHEAETVETPVDVSIPQPETEHVCPKCNDIMSADDRFCQECGFDTTSDTLVSDSKPEPDIVQPSFETPELSKPVIIPPAPETNKQSTPAYIQKERSEDSEEQHKGKKRILWIVLIIIGLGVLGTAGWFGYNIYLASSIESTDDTIIHMGIPESTDPDISVAETVEIEQPEDKANPKPMSRIDQELAKQRAKGKDKLARQNIDDQTDRTEIVSDDIDIVPKVILEVGRKEEPKNRNPKDPTKLMLRKPTMIVRITTDHYNDGMGTPRGGIITIKDEQGNTVGSYKALGKTGKNGTPSAKWVTEPNKILKKGTYFISDSDEATWSKTMIGGNGFVVVEGYVVE